MRRFKAKYACNPILYHCHMSMGDLQEKPDLGILGKPCEVFSRAGPLSSNHSFHSRIEEFAMYQTRGYLWASVRFNLDGNKLLHAASQNKQA